MENTFSLGKLWCDNHDGMAKLVFLLERDNHKKGWMKDIYKMKVLGFDIFSYDVNNMHWENLRIDIK